MLKTKILLSTFFLCIATWHVTIINDKGKSILFSIEKKLTSNEVVQIKVFSQLKVQSITFSPDIGNYSVWANGMEIANSTNFPIIKFSYSNDSVEVKTFENVIGKYKSIKISSAESIKSFRLKLVLPDRKPRIYEDNLLV